MFGTAKGRPMNTQLKDIQAETADEAMTLLNDSILNGSRLNSTSLQRRTPQWVAERGYLIAIAARESTLEDPVRMVLSLETAQEVVDMAVRMAAQKAERVAFWMDQINGLSSELQALDDAKRKLRFRNLRVMVDAASEELAMRNQIADALRCKEDAQTEWGIAAERIVRVLPPDVIYEMERPAIVVQWTCGSVGKPPSFSVSVGDKQYQLPIEFK